ncbi:lon [Gossypium arboreum]|uniref:Lon n=1 Tax=Gossypium arboreum TaxID=29729 RepID=A0A0B0PM95_GOSAR|nr:lon [Gossypium arboreum]
MRLDSRIQRKERTVSELEQAADNNKNSCTQQGRKELSSGQKVGRFQLFDITHRKKDGFLMTSEAREITNKLKDKKVEYEAIASSDSFVNLEDIDNRIITEILGPETYGRVRF